jgi:hypothetical protein
MGTNSHGLATKAIWHSANNKIPHTNSMNIPYAGAVTKHPKSQQRQTTPQLYKPGTENPA